MSCHQARMLEKTDGLWGEDGGFDVGQAEALADI